MNEAKNTVYMVISSHYIKNRTQQCYNRGKIINQAL